MELPQLVARLDVEKRQGEEDNGEQYHPKILHRESRSSRSRLMKLIAEMRAGNNSGVQFSSEPGYLLKIDSGLRQVRVSKRVPKYCVRKGRN